MLLSFIPPFVLGCLLLVFAILATFFVVWQFGKTASQAIEAEAASDLTYDDVLPESDTFIAGSENMDGEDDDFLPDTFFADDTDSRGIAPQRKALLVGINRYPGAPLRGCVNDSSDIREFLLDELWSEYSRLAAQGFQIRVLLNSKATAANMKRGYEWLLKGTRAEDIRLFGYSGHGTGVDDPREKDGYSESLCPVDFTFGNAGTHFTDDFMYEHYSKLPNGANFTMWLDCCHPWDDDRSLSFGRGIRNRSLPMPEHLANRTKATRTLGGRSNYHDSVLVIAGCRADQTSADAVFTVNGKNRFNGALTKNLLDSLRAMKGQSIESVMTETQARVKAQGYDQVPQIWGSERLKKLPFLAVK